MRAGRLDRTITVQRVTSAVDDFGTPVESWSDIATLRAEIVQASTREFFKDDAPRDNATIVFRTRFLDGITNADRVAYDGRLFDITDTKEIGRRRGLELRCVARA